MKNFAMNKAQIMGNVTYVSDIESDKGFFADVYNPYSGTVRILCNPSLKDKVIPGAFGIFKGRIASEVNSSFYKAEYKNSFEVDSFKPFQHQPSFCINHFTVVGTITSAIKAKRCYRVQLKLDGGNKNEQLLLIARTNDVINYIGQHVSVSGFESTWDNHGSLENVHTVTSIKQAADEQVTVAADAEKESADY